jgi:hypothetical protein
VKEGRRKRDRGEKWEGRKRERDGEREGKRQTAMKKGRERQGETEGESEYLILEVLSVVRRGINASRNRV